MENAVVRSNMRVIMRHLRRLPSAIANKHKIEHVRSQYTSGKLETDLSAITRMRENAQVCISILVYVACAFA